MTRAAHAATREGPSLFLAAGGGVATHVYWRINGDPTMEATTPDAALGTVGTSGYLSVLTNGSANVWSSYLQQVTVWKSGYAPYWVP